MNDSKHVATMLKIFLPFLLLMGPSALPTTSQKSPQKRHTRKGRRRGGGRCAALRGSAAVAFVFATYTLEVIRKVSGHDDDDEEEEGEEEEWDRKRRLCGASEGELPVCHATGP